MVSIGIDLGTTYSCVAIIENGRPVAIHNDDGRNTLPSVVAFSDEETLVGNSALDSSTDMANILYDSKRLLGWHILNDLPVAENRQLWTFNADTRNNCAGYILNRGTRNERFIRPEEVSAEILKSLKVLAEKYKSQKVIEAVVTVPAMFNSDQIAATKKAIELAGLKLKCLLQEPTAAAIAYNKKKQLGNSKLLVFDFGGGTLDISIVEIKNENFNVKAITGDAHLGGQDFDSRIMKFVIDEFNKSSPDYDIYKKPRLLKRLRTECREAKESLSFSNNPANVHLDINDDLEMNVRLTKEKFHELCSDLFEKAMILVDRALNMAQLSPEKIGHVILVGGSTRIPQIKQNINNKFRNSKIQFDINPDEAIAHGAAIVANDKNVYPSKILMHGHSISAQFPVSNFDRSAPRQTRVISVEKEDSPKSLFSSSSSFLPTSFFPNSSQQENVSYATTSVDDPMLRQRVSVGDRCICNGHPCTVRFIGYLKGHASIYAGVEFDDKVGEGTGEFEGETVFCTPNGYAGFVILSGLKVFRT